jgi:uncharacterized protein (UPF0261 family)
MGAAARAGIPQVVSVGALDMCNFGPPETVPARFAGRLFYHHNPQVTLMRTTDDECIELGKILARKLNAATGPCAVFIPCNGVSMLDAQGQPFHDTMAGAGLYDAISSGIDPEVVEFHDLDLHINDEAFADAMADRLLAMLADRAGA